MVEDFVVVNHRGLAVASVNVDENADVVEFPEVAVEDAPVPERPSLALVDKPEARVKLEDPRLKPKTHPVKKLPKLRDVFLIGQSSSEKLEMAADVGLDRVLEYLNGGGEDKNKLQLAKVGSKVVSDLVKLRATETQRMALEFQADVRRSRLEGQSHGTTAKRVKD